ncbi:hypothetical protein AGMMS50268_41410 [Spirochaetia bacterium]|nr:hypothetical protein AGMMS50268_41410 [Spirochaetia bacterium]
MKKIIITMALLVLLAAACSQDKGDAFNEKPISLDKDDIAARWAGNGFNPEGPSGAEGQTPPAFRDMSSLYRYAGFAYDDSSYAASSVSRQAASPDIIIDYQAINNKFVSTAALQIQLEDITTGDTALMELMNKYNAYSASANIYENTRKYIIKVPSDMYKPFLADLTGMGKVISCSETTEDVETVGKAP